MHFIERLRTENDMKLYYVLDEIEDNHFFCFKRIHRNVNDILFQKFNSLSYI